MCNLSINLSHLEDLIYYLCIYSHEIDKCLAVLCFINDIFPDLLCLSPNFLTQLGCYLVHTSYFQHGPRREDCLALSLLFILIFNLYILKSMYINKLVASAVLRFAVLSFRYMYVDVQKIIKKDEASARCRGY